MSNKKSGTDFEREFCQLTKDYGFWSHMLNANMDGQPADVIICKNNTPVLVDCKDCKSSYFRLDRIEENQELAMERWIKKGNDAAFFAVRMDENVWMIPFTFLKKIKDAGFSNISEKQIKKVGNLTFESWVVRFDAALNKQ